MLDELDETKEANNIFDMFLTPLWTKEINNIPKQDSASLIRRSLAYLDNLIHLSKSNCFQSLDQCVRQPYSLRKEFLDIRSHLFMNIRAFA